MRSFAVALLAAVATLAFAGSAQAATSVYFVESTAEAPAGSCRPITGVETAIQCDTLRAAVSAANVTPDADVVYLQAAGTYTVSSALDLTSDVTIYGRGPRTTTVQSAGTDRVFTVAAGVTAGIWRLTVSGGLAPGFGGDGGNVLNNGDLLVYSSRITGGTAGSGGGIANVGELTILQSLIDNNHAVGGLGLGGGVYSHDGASGDAAQLSAASSTIANNTAVGEVPNGGGIAIDSTGGQTTLEFVTIALNDARSNTGAGGLYVGDPDGTHIDGSIVTANTNRDGPRNCVREGTLSEVSPGSNLEGQSSCGFTNDGPVTVDSALSNQGGDTDVLTIPPTGGAKDAVPAPCAYNDQRNATRPTTGFCDAGAYEEGAEAPLIDDGVAFEPPPAAPTPVPPVTTPVPTPTPTPAAEPTPVPNKAVVGSNPTGAVKIKVPGSKTFVELDPTKPIPVGSIIDVKKGSIDITSVPKAGAPPETATFSGGIFQITQKGGITNLTLTEELAPCPKQGHAAAAKKPKTRKLFGNGKGTFRTSGKYSAATVRGTSWSIEDSCAGTTTHVKTGVVSVFDQVKKKTLILRKGKSYTARPKK